jgi:hypothetical protein
MYVPIKNSENLTRAERRFHAPHTSYHVVLVVDSCQSFRQHLFYFRSQRELHIGPGLEVAGEAVRAELDRNDARELQQQMVKAVAQMTFLFCKQRKGKDNLELI